MKNKLAPALLKKVTDEIERLQPIVAKQEAILARSQRALETIIAGNEKILALRTGGEFEKVEVAREIVTLGEQVTLADRAYQETKVDPMAQKWH